MPIEDLISHSSLVLSLSSPSPSSGKFLRRNRSFLNNSSNDEEQGVSSLAEVSLSRLHSRRSTSSSVRDQGVDELEGASEPKIFSTRTLKLSSSIDDDAIHSKIESSEFGFYIFWCFKLRASTAFISSVDFSLNFICFV